MRIPVLDQRLHLEGNRDPGADRLFGELQVVRRRLEQVLIGVTNLRRDVPSDREEWARVEQAAQTALRALQGALAAVPSLPFQDVLAVPNEFAMAGLSVSISERRAWYGETPMELSQMEFGLLVALLREPTRVFTRQELLRDVWGFRSPGRTRTLDSHTSRLRSKLREAGAPDGAYIVCLWGVGYSLVRPK